MIDLTPFGAGILLYFGIDILRKKNPFGMIVIMVSLLLMCQYWNLYPVIRTTLW